MVNKHTLYIPPYPHDGGARSGRTIASGHRFAFLRAAADAAIADYVCSRCSVARSFATLRSECTTCGMIAHFAGLAALGTRGRGPNAVWEGLVRRNELSFRRLG